MPNSIASALKSMGFGPMPSPSRLSKSDNVYASVGFSAGIDSFAPMSNNNGSNDAPAATHSTALDIELQRPCPMQIDPLLQPCVPPPHGAIRELLLHLNSSPVKSPFEDQPPPPTSGGELTRGNRVHRVKKQPTRFYLRLATILENDAFPDGSIFDSKRQWTLIALQLCQAALPYIYLGGKYGEENIDGEGIYKKMEKIKKNAPVNLCLHAEFWLGYAALYLAGDPDLACAHLKRVFARCPSNRHARLYYAESFIGRGRKFNEGELWISGFKRFADQCKYIQDVIKKESSEASAAMYRFDTSRRYSYSVIYNKRNESANDSKSLAPFYLDALEELINIELDDIVLWRPNQAKDYLLHVEKLFINNPFNIIISAILSQLYHSRSCRLGSVLVSKDLRSIFGMKNEIVESRLRDLVSRTAYLFLSSLKEDTPEGGNNIVRILSPSRQIEEYVHRYDTNLVNDTILGLVIVSSDSDFDPHDDTNSDPPAFESI